MAENPQSDYEHNVAVIANATFIEGRSLGLAASIVGVYWMKKPKAAPVITGKMDGLISLLQKAKVKTPKVHLTFDEGKPLALSLAGANSKNAGSVYVTDGGPFNSNEYYGRVAEDGTFFPSNRVNPKSLTALTAVLGALSSNPAKTASRYGHLTGKCCFCNRKLTDTLSALTGVGPECASMRGIDRETLPKRITIEKEQPHPTDDDTAVVYPSGPNAGQRAD